MRVPADISGVLVPRAREIVIASSTGEVNQEVELQAVHGAVVLRNMDGDPARLRASIELIASINDIERVLVIAPTTAQYGSSNSHGQEHISWQTGEVRKIIPEDLHFSVSGVLARTGSSGNKPSHKTLVLTTPTTVPYALQIQLLNAGRQDGMRLVGRHDTDFMHAADMKELDSDLAALLKPKARGGIGIGDVRLLALSENENSLVDRRAGHIESMLKERGIKVAVRSAEVTLSDIGIRQGLHASVNSDLVNITKVHVAGRLRVR